MRAVRYSLFGGFCLLDLALFAAIVFFGLYYVFLVILLIVFGDSKDWCLAIDGL